MRQAREAAITAEASALHGMRLPGETIIAFGEYDIYGGTTSRLHRNHPRARVMILRDVGRVPWVRNPAAFQELLALL